MSRPHELEAAVLATWDFSDPAASYDVFTQRAADAPPGTEERVGWQTQAARALGLQHDFDGATALLDTAATALPATTAGPARDHAAARLAIERGRVLNSSGDPAAARPLFDAAVELATSAGTEGLAVDALHMIAIVVGQTESPEASSEWNLRAIERAEASHDPAARNWRGSLLNNLAWDRHETGCFEDALDLFERALAAREETGAQPELNIARWSVARALRSLERYAEAVAIQRELAVHPDSADDGYVHEELAKCLLALGREGEAAASFARAHELLSQGARFAENEPERPQDSPDKPSFTAR